MEIDFSVHFGVTAYRLNEKKLPLCSVDFSVAVFCTHSDVEYFNSVSVLSV